MKFCIFWIDNSVDKKRQLRHYPGELLQIISYDYNDSYSLWKILL